MPTTEGAVVSRIEPGGIADRLGIRAGDEILRVNGHPVQDLIDILLWSCEEHLDIEWRESSGRTRQNGTANAGGAGLGLSFERAVFDGVRRCRNRCPFCFVDQLPKGMRPTLYVKDDDYRLSFLQGAYVTLTNLTDADRERIFRLRLSPLYVSVHATDPAIRGRLLGTQGPAPVLPDLRAFIDGGIEIHTQVVTCPGVNNGEVLDQTIADLSNLFPGVLSLAVVPVGLTAHRLGLPRLEGFGREGAEDVLELINGWQKRLMNRIATRFVFAADEWYLKSGREIPPDEDYEDYPQIANGVGLLRLFMTEFENLQSGLPKTVEPPVKLLVVTGMAPSAMLEQIAARLRQIEGLSVVMVPVSNTYLGPSVTVSGLVVGADVRRALIEANAGPDDRVFVPDIMLRAGENRFLDDVTLDDLSAATGACVLAIPATAAGLVSAIRQIEGGGPPCRSRS